MTDPSPRSTGFSLPKRRGLTSSPVGNEVMLRDAAAEMVHFLNPTAAVVWECCDGETSLQECVDRLRVRFKVPEDVDLAADIAETIDGFRAKGLLDG